MAYSRLDFALAKEWVPISCSIAHPVHSDTLSLITITSYWTFKHISFHPPPVFSEPLFACMLTMLLGEYPIVQLYFLTGWLLCLHDTQFFNNFPQF